MTPEQEYKVTQGTVIGEIRYEVYVKHGKEAYETAHYGWHNSAPSQDMQKIYTLVNSSPVQFLVATVVYPIVDMVERMAPIDPETNQKISLPPSYGPDLLNPSSLDLEWVDANIPFLSKDEVDKLGLTYTLP